MLKSLVPKDKEFFEIFDLISTNVHEAVKLLAQMLAEHDKDSEYAQTLKTLEHETDQIVHNLISRLHKTFVTPIDREDIHFLACRLDDVLDLTEAASSRLSLYRPDIVPSEAVQITAVLLESTRLVKEMVGLLHNMKNKDKLLSITVEVDRLEDEADYIRRSTLARLFREEKDVFELIKWKDILEYIERATDSCEDIANICEGIVLENS